MANKKILINLFRKNETAQTAEGEARKCEDAALLHAADSALANAAASTTPATTRAESTDAQERLTELVFIVDRSGSMSGMESDTIGGFNSVLKENRAAEGKAVVTTVLFDHALETLHDRVDIQNVEPMTERDYWVRGNTALLDAVGTTVKRIRSIQGYMPPEHKPDKSVCVIITDGMENSSHEYSYEQVKQIIGDAEKAGWEFLFLGANIDAAAEAGRIGIASTRAAQYVNDSQGASVLYDAVGKASVSMRQASLPADWAARIEKDTKSRRR